MPVAEKTKKVLFVCPGGLNLTLTVESESHNRESGVHNPGKRIYFQRRSFGGAYRGEYVTDKQEEIDYIRNHEWFRPGQPPSLEDKITLDQNGKAIITQGVGFGTVRAIYESEYNPEAKRESPETVRRFGEPSPSEAQIETAPQETASEPLKARIPKSLKKK